jgi:hypothetical protein
VSDNWGTITAWSGGVSAVAATLLSVIATLVKKPLHNPLFIVCLVVACLAFALLLLVGPAWAVSKWRSRRPRERVVTLQHGELAPVITEHWRSATNGLSTGLTQLRYNSMSHPAYMRCDPLKRSPPSMRIGIVIGCSELDQEKPETAEVRARFLAFLDRSEVMDFIRELTQVDSASWQPRNENPRFNFAAVLTSGSDDVTPRAWARILLPESWAPRYGHDAERASFVLHVELSGADGSAPRPRKLAIWQQRFAFALRLPTGLAAFLADELSLETAGDPPLEMALWLDASKKLMELVDIDGSSVVPGSPQRGDFTGYAIAESDGRDSERLAATWLRTMCDSSLHLRDSAAVLATLARTGGGPTH